MTVYMTAKLAGVEPTVSVMRLMALAITALYHTTNIWLEI